MLDTEIRDYLARWRREFDELGNNAYPVNESRKLSPLEEENLRLKRELADVKEERDILKKGGAHLLKETEVIYPFIGKHADEHAVEKMCWTFNFSHSGYYQWLKRKPSLRDRKDELLEQEILTIYHRGRGYYGSPCIHRDLLKIGMSCGRKRVERLMKELDISCQA